MNKREQLKKAYPNKTWAKKVDAMSEAQVVRLWLKFRSENKI